MQKLLSQLDDEKMDFTVKITDTDGVSAKYEFLDVVKYRNSEYAVLEPEDSDGFVDIFKIIYDGGEEQYERQTGEALLDEVFRLFRLKNEDEFDFD